MMKIDTMDVHDGSNLCSQEIDEALLAHPAVAGAGLWGYTISCMARTCGPMLRSKKALQLPISQDLGRFACERIGYKAPDEIVVLTKMALNPTGAGFKTGARRETG